MLWGWVQRWRTERRLATATDVLGLADEPRRSVEDLTHEQRAGLLTQLASTLEARDPYTHGHSRRVARHASNIAKRMGLSATEVAQIRTAGIIHDVGKVKVPTSVLHKEGKLSDGEFEVVKGHPVEGADMASPLGDDELTAMVRHHHERLDGTGYPDGLAGDSIPLGARIIAGGRHLRRDHLREALPPSPRTQEGNRHSDGRIRHSARPRRGARLLQLLRGEPPPRPVEHRGPRASQARLMVRRWAQLREGSVGGERHGYRGRDGSGRRRGARSTHQGAGALPPCGRGCCCAGRDRGSFAAPSARRDRGRTGRPSGRPGGARATARKRERPRRPAYAPRTIRASRMGRGRPAAGAAQTRTQGRGGSAGAKGPSPTRPAGVEARRAPPPVARAARRARAARAPGRVQAPPGQGQWRAEGAHPGGLGRKLLDDAAAGSPVGQ